MTEQRLESCGDGTEASPIPGGDNAVVPLNAATQGQRGQIRAANERDGGAVGEVQDVGFRMEALAGGLEDAKLHRALGLAGERGQVEQAQ